MQALYKLSVFDQRLKPGYPLNCRLSEVNISVFIMFIACLFHPSSVLCFDYPIVRQQSPTLITNLHLLRTYSIVCRFKLSSILYPAFVLEHLNSPPRIRFRVLTAMRYLLTYIQRTDLKRAAELRTHYYHLMQTLTTSSFFLPYSTAYDR